MRTRIVLERRSLLTRPLGLADLGGDRHRLGWWLVDLQRRTHERRLGVVRPVVAEFRDEAATVIDVLLEVQLERFLLAAEIPDDGTQILDRGIAELQIKPIVRADQRLDRKSTRLNSSH